MKVNPNMLLFVDVARIKHKGLAPIFFATVGMLFLTAGAKASSRPSTAELAAITERGRMLAEYDTAAWKATDALMAAHPKTQPSGRYIAHKTLTGWVVDFGRLNASEDKFLVAYEAVQADRQYTVRSFDPAREDTGWNLAAAKGIEAAMRDFGKADRPYNVAVLPVAKDSLYVYLYPAQVQAGVYPLGADIRYRFSSDGTKIVEKRPLHRAVIEYAAPAGTAEKAAGGYHTHVLTNLPEDTDVLLVLTRRPRVPEVVGAGAYVYTIDVDGAITVADRPR